MTADLRKGREQIELSARMLRQQNIEIEERRQYMEVVLKNVSTGVISTDAEGVITTVNTSAEKMLMIETKAVVGQDYQTLLHGPLREQATEMMEKLRNNPEESIEQPVRVTVSGRPRSFLVQGNALTSDLGKNIGIVLVFDDLTELEKAQRMAAWREVARRIAHEVKNPLTPITLSAQRLKRRYSEQIHEAVFDDCVKMIIDHVDLIRNLVNEFSSFARFPPPTLNPAGWSPLSRRRWRCTARDTKTSVLKWYGKHRCRS
jgi:two-component system nitrogen regulation sensor histidine kinase NtrY